MIAFNSTDSVKHIWIYQKGNGMVAVFPSPAVVKGGSTFSIVNKTTGDVTVTFPTGIDPRTYTICAEDAHDFTAANAPLYIEYEAVLAGGGGRSFYAEGNSKPNIIIQP